MITRELVSTHLDYDPETGNFYWLHNDDKPIEWNMVYAGEVAGGIDERGRVQIRLLVEGKTHKLYGHRLAWLMVYGYMPQCVRHKDGDKTNNRIGNLYTSTRQEVTHDIYRHTVGHHKVYGVNYLEQYRKWRANIIINNKVVHLGHFDTYEEALQARLDAEKKYGF